MLHAYLLVDDARTTQFNTRQDSEFCQLKRYFYQYVKSFRSQGNPVSWWSETTVGIINAYRGTGENEQLLSFFWCCQLRS